jgi:hypothetical protein
VTHCLYGDETVSVTFTISNLPELAQQLIFCKATKHIFGIDRAPIFLLKGEVSMLKVALAGLAALLASTTAAEAATYVGSRSLGTGSISLSITTDGTLGSLTVGNISDWNIAVTANNPIESFTFTKANSIINSGLNGGLVASPTSLTFDFDLGTQSRLEFVEFPIPSFYHYYCVETKGYCTGRVTGGGESIESSTDFQGIYVEPRSGIGTLGTASEVSAAVPEPANWAMMLIGFGMVGFAMRKRSNVRTTVSYA